MRKNQLMYYQNNRKKILNKLKTKYKNDIAYRKNLIKRQKIYQQKHIEKIKLQQKKYKLKNKEKIKLYQKKYRLKNKENLNKDSRLRGKIWYGKNKIRNYERAKKWLKNNKERYKNWRYEYRKKNPVSNSHYSLELQIAMNNVRKRDNNICKWYNCKLTNTQSPIHVHHIFPRSEYPELELMEKYMICYCANHHGLFHRYRGDKCYPMLQIIDKEKVIINAT